MAKEFLTLKRIDEQPVTFVTEQVATFKEPKQQTLTVNPIMETVQVYPESKPIFPVEQEQQTATFATETVQAYREPKQAPIAVMTATVPSEPSQDGGGYISRADESASDPGVLIQEDAPQQIYAPEPEEIRPIAVEEVRPIAVEEMRPISVSTATVPATPSYSHPAYSPPAYSTPAYHEPVGNRPVGVMTCMRYQYDADPDTWAAYNKFYNPRDASCQGNVIRGCLPCSGGNK
jgi:hypothetical protein